jgi:hypothetical protein
MDTSPTKDVVAGICGVLALVFSVIQFFWVPMAFGPLALIFLVIAISTSPKYKGLYELTAVLLVVGFVVGAAVAVIADNPLY